MVGDVGVSFFLKVFVLVDILEDGLAFLSWFVDVCRCLSMVYPFLTHERPV